VVTLKPDFEIDGEGHNIDSIAFWSAPKASRSMMFVTAKGNSLVEVWRYPFQGHGLPSLRHRTFGESPVNGVLVDQDANLLYVSIGSPASTVSVFSLPHLTFLRHFSKQNADFRGEPNLALLKLQGGETRLYVSADDRVFIHDAQNGDFLGQFGPQRGLETMVADDVHQVLYIPDENGRTGIYAYNPDGSHYVRNGRNHFGEARIFQNDAEGILIFACRDKNDKDVGAGLIVVSDQRSSLTDFEFFDRQTWRHLGTLRLEGISNTDGIASLQQALPDYPDGILAVIDNDSLTAIIGWDKILSATNLIRAAALPPPISVQFSLASSTTNPSHPTTTIRYSLPETLRVNLVIYDTLGKKVFTLQNGRQAPGHYRVVWDGLDETGETAASGLYFGRLAAGQFNETRKLLLLRRPPQN